jgi:hypothetical protein
MALRKDKVAIKNSDEQVKKTRKKRKKSFFGALKGIGPYEHEKSSDFD